MRLGQSAKASAPQQHGGASKLPSLPPEGFPSRWNTAHRPCRACQQQGGEEGSMYWWIIDLFLARDWGDLLGLTFLLTVFVTIAVLVIR